MSQFILEARVDLMVPGEGVVVSSLIRKKSYTVLGGGGTVVDTCPEDWRKKEASSSR